MVPTPFHQQQTGPQKTHDNYLSSINNIFCQTIYLPYIASTDDDETSVEDNTRIIINSTCTEKK
jgi:hypothetical protein